jgi:hypothetical protein
MAETYIRLHHRRSDGMIEDAHQDFGLENFGGFLPAVGDLILDSGVRQGLDRYDAQNRRMWTVVQRVFNPRENQDMVALVVEERAPLGSEECLLPRG